MRDRVSSARNDVKVWLVHVAVPIPVWHLETRGHMKPEHINPAPTHILPNCQRVTPNQTVTTHCISCFLRNSYFDGLLRTASCLCTTPDREPAYRRRPSLTT
jgi:hypothetical protein